MELSDSEQVEAAPAAVANPRPAANHAVVLRDRRALAPVAAGVPAVLSTAATLPGLLWALRRRWRLALFLGLLFGAGVTAATWFCLSEKFIARTLVLVDANPKAILGGEP